MELLPAELEEYILAHSVQEDDLLAELTRETAEKTDIPAMLSGPLQGKFLYLLIKMLSCKRALEIGMFTGYASIWMARALPPGGQLICLENSQLPYDIAQKYFQRAGVEKKIEIQFGPALESIAKLKDPLDFVFLDADKENYCKYYAAVYPLLRPGGLLVADNALWGGEVLESRNNTNPTTLGIQAFNNFICQDERVEAMLLPLRDGLFIVRKKDEKE